MAGLLSISPVNLAALEAIFNSCRMSTIAARELRNNTAEVLRRVEAGEEIEVLCDNRPVAKIIPLPRRRQWIPATEITHEFVRMGPDTTRLAEELRETRSETTDHLSW